eukprot:3936968-Rhodomonas_salina.2
MFTLTVWKKMCETLRNAADRTSQDDFISLASNNGGDLDQISAWYKVFVVLNTAQREAESSYASLSYLWGAYENSSRAVAELNETDFIDDDYRDEVIRIIDKFQLLYFNPISALAVVIDPRLGFVTEILEPMFESEFLRTKCAENPYVSCTCMQLAWQGMLYFTCQMDSAGVGKCRNALNLILDRGLRLFEQDYLLLAPDTHPSLWWCNLVRTRICWKKVADPTDACNSARAEEREAMDYFITNVAEKVLKISGTAASCERANSAMSAVHSKSRICLTSKCAEMLTFVYYNSRLARSDDCPLSAKPGCALGSAGSYELGAMWDNIGDIYTFSSSAMTSDVPVDPLYLSDNADVDAYDTTLQDAGLEQMLSGRVGGDAEEDEDD